MPCPSHPLWLDHSNYNWQTVQATKLLIMQFLQPPITSFLFDPNILNALFSNTLSLCSPLMSEVKFHNHTKPQAKLQFCIFFYVFREQTRRKKVRIAANITWI
jgi:hypothetical protein